MKDDENKSNKNAQLMVLETLNNLINEAAVDDDERRAISVAAVIVYNDGSSTSNISGDLSRAHMTGLLVDLSNQVFFECKQREINEQIECSVRAMHLANAPTGSKPN